jgi:hypothetical protein
MAAALKPVEPAKKPSPDTAALNCNAQVVAEVELGEIAGQVSAPAFLIRLGWFDGAVLVAAALVFQPISAKVGIVAVDFAPASNGQGGLAKQRSSSSYPGRSSCKAANVLWGTNLLSLARVASVPASEGWI